MYLLFRFYLIPLDQKFLYTRVGTNYQNAVAAFNAVPENVDTLDELKSVDYRDSAVQEGWENWGATQFQEAIDEATLELAG